MKKDTKSERYINKKGRYSRYWSQSYVSALTDHVVGEKSMQ